MAETDGHASAVRTDVDMAEAELCRDMRRRPSFQPSMDHPRQTDHSSGIRHREDQNDCVEPGDLRTLLDDRGLQATSDRGL